MKRAILIYAVLLIVLVLRINKTCEGDFAACQGIGDKRNRNEDVGSDKTGRLESFRTKTTELARKNLPSPHSELLLGMTVGIDKLYEVPKFKKMLRETGTIHVVVVSGYNVTLVYNTVVRLLGTPYKSRNLILAIAGTLLFAFVSGFEPPVVRAWIMGSIIAMGKFYGRKINALSVLILTGVILIMIDPGYLYNLSFQLSFLATLSLILFESRVSKLIGKVTKADSVFIDDLSATISAQMLIWPYLSHKFGQISLLSPVVNALILWTVPLATVVGSVFLAVSALSEVLGSLLAIIVYISLDFFVHLVEYFSKFEQFVLEKEVSLTFLTVYYCALVLIYRRKEGLKRVK